MDAYRGAKPLDPQTAPAPKGVGKLGLTGGLVRNASPREIDLGASPFMEDMRFERSGIRKEFGDRALGTSAESRILSIV